MIFGFMEMSIASKYAILIFKINFMHLWLLIKDAWRTKSWSSKLKIWFMPTGWRPADVEAQYPVDKIEVPA